MLLVADGRVGTRDRHNDDLLALPRLTGLEGLGDTADLTRVELRSPRDVAEEGVGDLVALSSGGGVLRSVIPHIHQAL